MAVTAAQQQSILENFVRQRNPNLPIIWDAPTLGAAIITLDNWVTNNQASIISALESSAPGFLGPEPNQAQLNADLNILFQLVLSARYVG